MQLETKPAQAWLGRKILSASIHEYDLLMNFMDGSTLIVRDYGQCCEQRYMQTDDKLEDCAGGVLLGISVKPGRDYEDGEDWHEIQFLDIETTNGTFQIASHNIHNGNYSGFYLEYVFCGAEELALQ
jgi:hypothetical protein